jgi:hypothetical protein
MGAGALCRDFLRAPVEALVGQLHDRRGIAHLCGDLHDPVGGGDREGGAVLAKRRHAGMDEALIVLQ